VARAGRSGGEGGSRGRASAARLAREVSALQAELLDKLREEMPDADVEAFASAAKGLAEAFGQVTAAALDPLGPAAELPDAVQTEAGKLLPQPDPERLATQPDSERLASLYRPGVMRRRLDQLVESHRRYGHPFCVAVFDVAGPAVRNGGGGGAESPLTVVGDALRESVRLVDETFSLEEDALCVLAPDQNTIGGVQMSHRLLTILDDLEASGGLPVEISAGVVACPEHGADAETLLRSADEAMWRARAVGQPVGIGLLQDR
jgi:diguanylate cyclase (GGDEF)-like protein